MFVPCDEDGAGVNRDELGDVLVGVVKAYYQADILLVVAAHGVVEKIIKPVIVLPDRIAHEMPREENILEFACVGVVVERLLLLLFLGEIGDGVLLVLDRLVLIRHKFKVLAGNAGNGMVHLTKDGNVHVLNVKNAVKVDLHEVTARVILEEALSALANERDLASTRIANEIDDVDAGGGDGSGEESADSVVVVDEDAVGGGKMLKQGAEAAGVGSAEPDLLARHEARAGLGGGEGGPGHEGGVVEPGGAWADGKVNDVGAAAAQPPEDEGDEPGVDLRREPVHMAVEAQPHRVDLSLLQRDAHDAVARRDARHDLATRAV